jgi:hypothetical protein
MKAWFWSVSFFLIFTTYLKSWLTSNWIPGLYFYTMHWWEHWFRFPCTQITSAYEWTRVLPLCCHHSTFHLVHWQSEEANSVSRKSLTQGQESSLILEKLPECGFAGENKKIFYMIVWAEENVRICMVFIGFPEPLGGLTIHVAEVLRACEF